MGQYYYVPGPGEQTNGFQPTMPDRITQARQNQNSGSIMPPAAGRSTMAATASTTAAATAAAAKTP